MNIGLVGYRISGTGLGEVNRQLASHAGVTDWRTAIHGNPTLPCPEGIRDWPPCTTVRPFVEAVDAVLFAETPFVMYLIAYARELKKRVVCIPMQEWKTPDLPCVRAVGLFLCPTRHCFDHLSGFLPADRLRLMPWPCDTVAQQFRPRGICFRFLYLHGRGGVNDRKGGEVIREALRLWPEFPLTIRTYFSQEEYWGVTKRTHPNVVILSPAEDNRGIYDGADILLVPHRVDGIGMECLEAASAGMPMIVTQGRPWNEYPWLSSIRSTEVPLGFRGVVERYDPDPQALIDQCKIYLGLDVSEMSRIARKWAEERSWEMVKEDFRKAVRGD